RAAILASLTAAQEAIARHAPERILTLGGECAVSVAPFAALAEKYGEDLAVVWIDAHPDADTPATGYDRFHAMAAATLIGQGGPSRSAAGAPSAWPRSPPSPRSTARISRWSGSMPTPMRTRLRPDTTASTRWPPPP